MTIVPIIVLIILAAIDVHAAASLAKTGAENRCVWKCLTGIITVIGVIGLIIYVLLRLFFPHVYTVNEISIVNTKITSDEVVNLGYYVELENKENNKVYVYQTQDSETYEFFKGSKDKDVTLTNFFIEEQLKMDLIKTEEY